MTMISCFIHFVIISIIYLPFSLADDFDFTVCMEFLEFKQKLGQGGFGSVYLAWDSLNE
jgi:serine/threonine protein kinase